MTDAPKTRFITRYTKDDTGIELARTVAKRSTCLRRAVGCVLMDPHGRIIGTGYNGVARGQPHCNEPGPPREDGKMIAPFEGSKLLTTASYPHACRAAGAKSGTQLDGCGAIHAEQNALMHCAEIMAIHTCYVTTSPCMTCVKMLLNTPCERIVFAELYPHDEAKDLWTQAGRAWIQYDSLKEIQE